MRYKLNKLLVCILLLFSGQVVAQAEQACLITGVSHSGEKISDCIINTGIAEQAELAKFCHEYTELRSSFERNPEPEISYSVVCPAQEQAQCLRPAGKNAQVLFFSRTPAQLALEQEYCDLLGGNWVIEAEEEEKPVTAVSEIYNLCNYLEGKNFVSLQRFTYGLSLLSYQWKLEISGGKILWRKNADGNIEVRSMETGEVYEIEASIYSSSVTFEGVAYDQLLPR